MLDSWSIIYLFIYFTFKNMEISLHTLVLFHIPFPFFIPPSSVVPTSHTKIPFSLHSPYPSLALSSFFNYLFFCFTAAFSHCGLHHPLLVVVMVQENGKRKRPNILVTGTPGTGKTTMCTALAEATQLHHINVGDLVKEKNLHDGWDDELDCYILNEDLVCDELEDVMEEGGNIVDYHGCDFFPERWFDCVVVLQTDNTVLYDRLNRRGYNDSKLSNNIECEIFQVILEEAKESYPEYRVIALKSDTIEDISRNVTTLTDWVRNWHSAS